MTSLDPWPDQLSRQPVGALQPPPIGAVPGGDGLLGGEGCGGGRNLHLHPNERNNGEPQAQPEQVIWNLYIDFSRPRYQVIVTQISPGLHASWGSGHPG